MNELIPAASSFPSELPRGEAGADAVVPSAPPVAHRSALSCGCDPGCNYLCDEHASDPARNFIPRTGE